MTPEGVPLTLEEAHRRAYRPLILLVYDEAGPDYLTDDELAWVLTGAPLP